MSKKVLILGAVVVALVGGAAVYAWVDYSQAQNSLGLSQLYVHDVEDNVRRHPEDVGRLKELYKEAKLQVDLLEKHHHAWIGKDVISGLQTSLEKQKQAIDGLAGRGR